MQAQTYGPIRPAIESAEWIRDHYDGSREWYIQHALRDAWDGVAEGTDPLEDAAPDALMAIALTLLDVRDELRIMNTRRS